MTKWFMEINTGVYVGNVSSRVRNELWSRICDNIKNGQATMVYRSNGEQHMDFRVHNTSWTPVDYDGIKLMLRPSAEYLRKQDKSSLKEGFSKAAQYRKVQRIQSSGSGKPEAYVAVDVETTSLKPETGSIIEIAAVKSEGGVIRDEFCRLIKTEMPLDIAITELTGITDKMLAEEGVPLKTALVEFIEFIGENNLVFHNALFDMAFLRKACQICGLSQMKNRTADTLTVAKKKLRKLPNFRLETIAEHFGIEEKQRHRALSDCRMTAQVYEKLKEI
jgi:CRISPR-associated protein Cas2